MPPLLSALLLSTNTRHPRTKGTKGSQLDKHDSELSIHFRVQFHPTQVGPTLGSHFSAKARSQGPYPEGGADHNQIPGQELKPKQVVESRHLAK